MLPVDEQVGSDEQKEKYRDHAVHSEKGRIELRQIVRPHQRVFVDQKCNYRNDTEDGQFAQAEDDQQRNQQAHHDQMKDARNP